MSFVVVFRRSCCLLPVPCRSVFHRFSFDETALNENFLVAFLWFFKSFEKLLDGDFSEIDGSYVHRRKFGSECFAVARIIIVTDDTDVIRYVQAATGQGMIKRAAVIVVTDDGSGWF